MSMIVPSQGACASSPTPSARSRKRPLIRVLFPAIPLIVLVSLGAYVAYCWSLGLSRTVWLVNGLAREYDVRIDGKVHHLMPHEARPIKVSEGQVQIASAHAATPFPDQTCRISTPLLTRPFTKPLFVINPDQTALVYEEDTLFAREVPKSLEEMDRHTLYTGQLAYRFSNIDYPFNEFPDSVTGENGSSSVRKKKVALWTIGSPDQRARLIEKEIGPDAAVAFVKHLAICNPDDHGMVMLLATVMSHDQVISFLRSRLDVRPVQVAWHRSYQQLISRVQPNYDLTAEYRARVNAQPDDSSLMYLLGRIVSNPAESDQWLRKSTSCAFPSGYGFYALAYRALSHGDFERALIMAQEAATLLPDNLDARSVESEALAATGHYDRLLNRAREEQSKTPLDPRPVLQEIQLLTLQSNTQQAHRVSDAFVARANGSGRGEMIRQFKLRSEALIDYAAGNLAEFVMTLERNPLAPDAHFQHDLSLGRLDDAAADLSSNPGALAAEHLLLAIAAMDVGRDDLATRHLQLASTGYAMGDNDMRRVAKWLSQLQAPNPDEACEVQLMPDQKRLVLTALGLKDPTHRDRYFKAAAELNYDRAFPYLTVKRVLDGSVVALK